MCTNRMNEVVACSEIQCGKLMRTADCERLQLYKGGHVLGEPQINCRKRAVAISSVDSGIMHFRPKLTCE